MIDKTKNLFQVFADRLASNPRYVWWILAQVVLKSPGLGVLNGQMDEMMAELRTMKAQGIERQGQILLPSYRPPGIS
jgi:hypothetical protein